MLVCSVVLRPERGALAAMITEAANALDAPSLGIRFLAQADEPGNARDVLEGFIGQRMLEPTSAIDTVNALSLRPASVIEEISASVASQDAALNVVVPLTARHSMAGTVFVNSAGTARQANADGTMINL